MVPVSGCGRKPLALRVRTCSRAGSSWVGPADVGCHARGFAEEQSFWTTQLRWRQNHPRLFLAASLAFSSCLFCCSPSTSIRPQTRSLLCVWSSQCCLICSGSVSREGTGGWMWVPSLLASCSQVWGYLVEELKAGVFFFSGINLLSASSQAVPVPCWVLLLFWKLVLPGSASLGEGLGRSVHLSPGSHCKLPVLDGSLYLELLF